MTNETFSIGEAAAASDLPVKTIRYYEEIGIIPRAPRRKTPVQASGHRIFNNGDIGRLKFIRHARLLGLALSEVRDFIAIAEEDGCPGNKPEYRKILAQHLRNIDERIGHLHSLRTKIKKILKIDRPKESDGCIWETCTCMDPSPRE